MNIKDPEAHRLASAIARETGESLTRVVIEALRERYQRLSAQRSKANLGELMAIANRMADRLQKRPINHAELLYDENALPK